MAPDYPAKSKNPKKKSPGKSELARAVEELAKMPFPERSADDAADQLHAELLLFDSAVGETVMAIVNGDRVPKEDLRGNPELHHDLEQLSASEDPNTAADAQNYLDYLQHLENLLHLAREATIHKKKH